MPMISLAPNCPEVSAFCLGTMTWGRQTPVEDAHRQIDMALDHGINFLDTAEMYPVNPIRAETRGDSEVVIGDWLARGGARDRLVIATKVTGVGSAVIEGGAPPITPVRLRQAVEGSLDRLRTDHIDLYQLHWPNRGSYHFRRNWHYRPPTDRAAFLDHVQAILTEAAALIGEGKISALGLSNETAWGLSQWLREAHDGLPRVAAVQNEYSLMCRLFDTDLAEACAMEGVTLLGFSPLATGLLTGKYAGDAMPAGSRRVLNPDLGGRTTPRAFDAAAAYVDFARAHDLDPVQMSLAWFRTRPFAAIPILGATHADQLARQIPALDLKLTPEVIAALDDIHRAHPMPY